MVFVGQTLWGINKETGMEETVKVIEVNKGNFRIEYKGLKKYYPFTVLNSIFYTEPRTIQKKQTEKKCDNCFLKHTGECTSLSGVVCDDYRAKQTLDQNDIDNWPKYGDATAYKMRDRQHFK